MKTIIETFQEQHKEQIINLILNIQINEFDTPITRQDQPDLENIHSFYQKANGNFWVAKLNDKVVGTIALLDIGNSQGALRKMFVAKEYRGKETSVANQLLLTLLEWSKLKDFKEIYLGTRAIFLSAHRFYEKNGFIEIEKKNLPTNFPIMQVDTKFYQFNQIQ